MKSLKHFALIALAFGLLASCTSVRVVSDYDQKADFNTYKSYAFYKTGIDKTQISDLDKKRILRAIEAELGARGFQKGENTLAKITSQARLLINAKALLQKLLKSGHPRHH